MADTCNSNSTPTKIDTNSNETVMCPMDTLATTVSTTNPPTTVTPVKTKEVVTHATANDYNDDYSYGTKKDSPTLMQNPKIITRNVTKTIKTEDEEDKVVHVMENIYETVRTRDTNIAIKEGLLLPIRNGQGESHFIITKITNKRSKEDKEKRMNLLIESFFRYYYVGNDPQYGHAAREIFESHVVCMYLKEVEEDEDEPFYTIFGNDKNLKLALNPMEEDGVYKFNCACYECRRQDACDDFLFGSYCVAAVRLYFAENKYHSKLKGAYQVFVAN